MVLLVAEPNDAERIVALLRGGSANYKYFFERVDDPAWLPFLVANGFFKSPPPPERDEGWIRFPAWPESKYLIRVADHSPDEVLAAALGVPETENVRVHEDLMRVAAILPKLAARRLARREAKWLKGYDGPLMSLPGAAGELLAALGRESETNVAYGLAHALLDVSPSASRAGTRSAVQARLNDWEYGKIIETAWPALMAADPTTAFRFLCDRLRETVRIAFIEADGYDSTRVWRPAIEDHAQNLGHSLFDTIVDWVRDLAVQTSATPEGLSLILAALQHYDEPIFARIEMHVLQHHGPEPAVETALTNLEAASSTELWHEYAELLRARYPDLPPTSRKSILDLIASGPNWEANDEEGARRQRRWKLMRYAMIAQHLQGASVDEYRELTAEFGQPDHPSFLSYHDSWSGPTSPFSLHDLQAMGPSGVADALGQWRATGDPDAPTPEGLGRILADAVSNDAPGYATHAESFAGLDATYVRAVLNGLTDALKERIAFPWDNVLSLSEWVVAQPRSSTDTTNDWGQDPHWGWARRQVADLLSHGFDAGAASLPSATRPRVWSILEELIEDPDPLPDREERIGDGDLDALTRSINTTRGEAMHALVRYVLWVERQQEDGRLNGLASVPEAMSALERHLDAAIDRSLAIRAVYGKWFAQFVRIDPSWAERVEAQVFPQDDDPRFGAAWGAYINFTPAWTDVFAVLKSAYAYAIGRPPSATAAEQSRDESWQHLGSHLFTFRVIGLIGLGDDDLFVAYWRASSPSMREQVLSQIGWSIQGPPRSLDADVKAEFQRTWEWIVEEAERTGETKSLAAFGSWLAAQDLDPNWLVDQAVRVLRMGIHLDNGHTVYEALPRLAAAAPLESLDIVELMVATDTEGWTLMGSEETVRETVQIAMAHDALAVRERARAVGELLLARGFAGFRDLLV